LLFGAVRATVQLILVGHVLLWLFVANLWYLVIGLMLLMVTVAAFTAAGRQAHAATDLAHLRTICGIAIWLVCADHCVRNHGGSASHTVVQPALPDTLFGMIVSNSMNGAALAAERLQSEMNAARAEIEAYLALGASPDRAASEPVRRALVAAMIPAVNSLRGDRQRERVSPVRWRPDRDLRPVRDTPRSLPRGIHLGLSRSAARGGAFVELLTIMPKSGYQVARL